MLRAVGLRGAVAINVCAMIGAGPLITIPLVVVALHGSVSVVVWILGAIIALCDGLVWAELASAYPRAGGTYAYLRDALGANGPGRLFAFMFVWQYLFWAPLILASGYVGFAQYAGYLVPALAKNPLATHLLAAGVGVVTLAALWRPIPVIARTATILGSIAIATLLAVAVAGFSHPHPGAAVAWSHALDVRGLGLAAIGAALVIVLYDYSGYGDVCALGEEVIAPSRTLPRAIAWSVGIVGAAYVLLNIGIFTGLPADAVAKSSAVASLAVERAWGNAPAIVVTVAILVTAFASTYGLLLAAARVPFAAARDGDFLAPFARLHERARFPSVALFAIGALAIPAAFLKLDDAINALTAGIALIQGVGQCAAVVVMRSRGVVAPYRIPLFPLPVLVAAAAWVALFVSSGQWPMLFGAVTLLAGAVVFLIRAARGRIWPFAIASSLALVAFGIAKPAAATPAWGHAQVVVRNGAPRLEVDGAPFFFWGGAFFYERIPPSAWRPSMEAMRELGANTLDLYVPWNWHELRDGEFDFDGRTDPRRNLREVLRLGRELGFHFIVRPGPLVRNEWRNGGYPAWLLERPEYNMPLHDVLEGRYAATATLQNAHSDDAAAEWLANPTHLRLTARWVRTALHVFDPVADRVLAVQLDDDQAAYIDNQTYPAPNLRRYLEWLDAQVRTVTGPAVPTFINTFEMRVPASSPVWTMGNWYQSDAYLAGDHDRAQLDFATLLLAQNPRGPLAQSEFQAGWLAGADDPQPRPADPSNTLVALSELLALGVHGVVDFPLQDTVAPYGWEAPWSNAAYAWDAALPYEPWRCRAARWAPTNAFGEVVRTFGPLLAQTIRRTDVAVPWLAVHGTDASRAAAIAWAREAIAACARANVSCALVDVASGGRRALLRAPRVLRPPAAAISSDDAAALDALPNLTAALPARAFTTLDGPGGSFAVAVNWSASARSFALDGPHAGGSTTRLGSVRLAPRSAGVFPLGARVAALIPGADARLRLSTSCRTRRTGATLQLHPTAGACIVAIAGPIAVRRAIGESTSLAFAGTRPIFTRGLAEPASALPPCAPVAPPPGPDTQTFTAPDARIVIAPAGGARIVAFSGAQTHAFDATGALRDDVSDPPAPSPRDYIAKYTHDYPAGMFNRTYTFDARDATSATLSYTAPDLDEPATRFERRIALDAHAARLVVDERIVTTRPGRRLVVHSSLGGTEALGPAPSAADGGFGLHLPDGGSLLVTWRPSDVERATWQRFRSTGTLSLTFAPGWHRTTFTLVSSSASATQAAQAERDWLWANPGRDR